MYISTYTDIDIPLYFLGVLILTKCAFFPFFIARAYRKFSCSSIRSQL